MSSISKDYSHMTSGVYRHVNEEVVHPYTKLDLESADSVANKVFNTYAGEYSSQLSRENVFRIITAANRMAGRVEEASEEDIDDFISFHSPLSKAISRNTITTRLRGYLTGPGNSGLNLSQMSHIRSSLVNYLVNAGLDDSSKNIDLLFDTFDHDKNGALDRSEISHLIKETFQFLGINEEPSESQINFYLQGKQHISKPEYQNLVMTMLKNGSLNISSLLK